MPPRRKPLEPQQSQTALGYINRLRLPAGVTPEAVGLPIRSWAEERGYRWGGTYLAASDDEQTVAALTRAAGRLEVEVIVVPSSRHLPAGQHVVVSRNRCTRVVAIR